MLPTTGGRRLVVLIRRTAAAAACGTNPLRLHRATVASHCFWSAPLARTPDSDTASYLVASCGLSPAAAAALTSHGIRIRSTAVADTVLSLLRHHGFSDAQIARLLRMSPQLLLLDPDKIIRPKLEFFASLGIPAAVLASSSVLDRSLEKHLVPCVELLRGILGSDANIRAALSRNHYGFSLHIEKQLRPAVEALRRHGLSEEAISKLLVLQLGVLRMAPDRIAGIFEDLEALGLPITDSRFVRAFVAMCRLKRETAWRRLALYQSFGLSKSQVAKAFMSQPSILELTDETIQEKLPFFRDKLKITLPLVIARPKVLTLSVEKNILPKCVVLGVLMREGKMGRDINLTVPLDTSHRVFFERYVKKYEKDVPDVVMAYEGKIKFKGFMDEDHEVSLKPRHQSSSVNSL